MRILFVRRASVSVIDGISMYILELSSALMRMGHEVYILCGNGSNIDKDTLREHFLIDEIPPTIDWGKVPWIPGIRNHSLLKKICDNLDIDIVHFHGFIPYFGKLDRPLVMTHHGFPIFIEIKPLFKLGYKVLQYFFNYDVIIAVSRKHLDEIRRILSRLSRRATILPPGINVQKIRSSVEISSERENMVVHVGTRKEKNPEVSIIAFAIACKRYSIKDFKLIIVGSLNDRLVRLINKLPQDIWDKIIFTGVLSRIKLLNLIAKSKILIAPSVYESFHILSLEASALGTPVIASGAIPEEAVADKVNGLRVEDPHDYEAFAKALVAILTNEDLWHTLHRNALKRAELLDSDRIARKLVEIYESLEK